MLRESHDEPAAIPLAESAGELKRLNAIVYVESDFSFAPVYEAHRLGHMSDDSFKAFIYSKTLPQYRDNAFDVADAYIELHRAGVPIIPVDTRGAFVAKKFNQPTKESLDDLKSADSSFSPEEFRMEIAAIRNMGISDSRIAVALDNNDLIQLVAFNQMLAEEAQASVKQDPAVNEAVVQAMEHDPDILPDALSAMLIGHTLPPGGKAVVIYGRAHMESSDSTLLYSDPDGLGRPAVEIPVGILDEAVSAQGIRVNDVHTENSYVELIAKNESRERTADRIYYTIEADKSSSEPKKSYITRDRADALWLFGENKLIPGDAITPDLLVQPTDTSLLPTAEERFTHIQLDPGSIPEIARQLGDAGVLMSHMAEPVAPQGKRPPAEQNRQ